jgi:hypothetical protein
MPVQTSRLHKPHAAPAVMRECGICQSAIEPAEETHTCPSCGLTFHAECWQENWGCSAYGCNQVNALKPAGADQPSAAESQAIAEELEAAPFPWDYLILGVCAFAMLLSGLTFGVPSLLATLAIITRINFRDRIKSDMNLWLMGASAAACAIGIIAGWMMSSFWWLGTK